MKFNFTAAVVIEADTEEGALKAVSYRLSVIARHISEQDISLADNDPFFTLVQVVDTTDAHDITTDPLAPAAEAPSEPSADGFTVSLETIADQAPIPPEGLPGEIAQ